jgi:DTW domain-containing protein YfiP
VDPKRWAVLFVGTQKNSAELETNLPFQIVEKNGKPVPLKGIEGIVLLDGNWKQSKTLWWRNAWLLKLNRVLLNPDLPSLYGNLRKEPRKNCLSTLEAAAESLVALGEKGEIAEALRGHFSRFLDKVRST